MTLTQQWASSAAPPPTLTVSQWADAKRILPVKSAARGARWRTDQTPYLRGVMDAIHEPGVRSISVEKGAQIGGSEAIHNIIGYLIEHAPCATMLVHPTAEVAEDWSKERLDDMIRSSPALDAVINQRKSKLTYKEYPNGFLVLGGANTPNTFARWSVRVAMGDDVDRWPAIVGEEGDPIDLLANRTTTYDDALLLFVSTPTLKGGRIDTLYERSDQRRYHVACPICGREDWITWSDPSHFRVAFDERSAATARLECPSPEHGGCGARLYEPERRAMIGLGRWRPTTEPKDVGAIGFHLPSMLSTFSSVTLESLVNRWLSAREKGKENLRVFVNTQLAEGWEDRGARMNPQSLMSRREDFGDGVEVPFGAVAITAGVDVQDDRFEVQVQAWGSAEERWVINYVVVPGDPRRSDTRSELLRELSRRYVHATGAMLPIHATCVDTGYATEEMYDFVLAYQSRRIYATKGVGNRSGDPIVGKPSEKRYGRNPRPVRLYLINTDDAKKQLMGSLALVGDGPGRLHFPLHLDTVNEEYFAQLCAEHEETRRNRQGVATHTVWVQDRDRNEALDTSVLCHAAYRLLNPNIRQMLEVLGADSVRRAERGPSEAGGTTVVQAPAAAPSRPVRRRSESDYLRRNR